MKRGYLYILTNKPYGTLYVGVTSDLGNRLYIHRQRKNKGSFTSQYKLFMLVFYEEFPTIFQAIKCEKRIKYWRRDWKIRLITEKNPEWKDLAHLFLSPGL